MSDLDSIQTNPIHVGKTYQHYKGKNYRVIAIARYSEDPNMRYVVYQALYDTPQFGSDTVWVRPYEMFAEDVIVNGVLQPRFKKID